MVTSYTFCIELRNAVRLSAISHPWPSYLAKYTYIIKYLLNVPSLATKLCDRNVFIILYFYKLNTSGHDGPILLYYKLTF